MILFIAISTHRRNGTRGLRTEVACGASTIFPTEPTANHDLPTNGFFFFRVFPKKSYDGRRAEWNATVWILTFPFGLVLEGLMYFLFMLVACLCGPCITHGMLTFILPWLPPLALPSQIIGRTSSRSGATPAKSDCWCFSTPFGQDHADPRWHVGAGGACGPLAPSDDSLRRRRLRRRRTATYLGSAVGGNEEHDTGAFHPVRGIEVDGRSNVELLARLKAMGRRFEWRGALKVFRRAKAEGLVADNNVYRLELRGLLFYASFGVNKRRCMRAKRRL